MRHSKGQATRRSTTNSLELAQLGCLHARHEARERAHAWHVPPSGQAHGPRASHPGKHPRASAFGGVFFAVAGGTPGSAPEPARTSRADARRCPAEARLDFCETSRPPNVNARTAPAPPPSHRRSSEADLTFAPCAHGSSRPQPTRRGEHAQATARVARGHRRGAEIAVPVPKLEKIANRFGLEPDRHLGDAEELRDRVWRCVRGP
jgi:hypothetical protein